MNQETNRNLNPGKRMLSFFVVLMVLSLGIGIGTLITYRVGAIGPGDSQLKIQSDSKPIVGEAVIALSQAFASVAKEVEPAVVNINTEEVVRLTRRGRQQNPMEDFFNRFFDTPEQFTRRSLGSGILVDPKGYIITNNHVVESATKIRVNLDDGTEFSAKVVAADPLSDLAVIKIESSKDLRYARIGDAKSLKVGDWVLAIGSPFGLEQTVTAGIISATGRVFPDSRSMAMLFNDYLQTDAAINPGNSGGPLVNMNGEVVGINTFISTNSSSNAGVGFAVPAHIVVNVYNQILEKGKVARGWIGVNMNTLPFTPAMARYFGVKGGKGVLITGLSDETGQPANTGPAAVAGVQAEDVVVEFDGKTISDVQDFRLAVANAPPGKKVPMTVIRKGSPKTMEVTLAERKLEDQNRGNFSFEVKEEEPKPEIGLSFNDVPSQLAREIDLKGGAIVTEVKPGSLADEAGLVGQEQGGGADIIVTANGKPINTGQDLFAAIRDLRSGDAVVLKFLRLLRTTTGYSTSTFYTSITKP